MGVVYTREGGLGAGISLHLYMEVGALARIGPILAIGALAFGARPLLQARLTTFPERSNQGEKRNSFIKVLQEMTDNHQTVSGGRSQLILKAVGYKNPTCVQSLGAKKLVLHFILF